MKEKKVRGIVLRQDPMGDKDRRIVLLTRETGKLTVLAKGAMSPKSRFGALTQPFCYGDYVLTKGRTFYYIKEAELVESFYPLREDLWRMAYGVLMLEVAETLSLEGQENEELLMLLLRGLWKETKAKQGKESIPAETFIFRALSRSGFYPQLERCMICGRELSSPAETERVFFDAGMGSVVCSSCAKNSKGISRGCLRALRYMIEAKDESAFSFDLSETVLREVEESVTSYLLEQTERRYKGLDFLDNLRLQS